MTVHPQALGLLGGRFAHRAEQRVSEIPLAGGTSMRLNVVPQVVIGKFENTRE